MDRQYWYTELGTQCQQPHMRGMIYLNYCSLQNDQRINLSVSKQAHFAETMWEKDRCDGKRKLKCNAVPTIFPFHSVSYNFPGLSENCNKNNNGINMLITSLTDEGEVETNFQYQLQPEDSSSIFASISANMEEGTNWKKRCEELMHLLTKSKNECEKLRNVMKRREELFNRIIRKSYKYGEILKKRLRKLREENRIYDKLKIRLGEIFNEDQIKALTNQGVSCREWSDETIKRAIRLRLTCGSVGYQQILDQNIPLPSERTLRRKMNSIELNENM